MAFVFVRHSTLSLGDIHPIHAFVYADKASRESAAGLVASDVGRVALQTDDGTYWTLISHSPVTWRGIGEVFGPAGSTNHNIPQFQGTTGKLIEDSGVPISSIVNAVSGPATAVDQNLPQFDGTSGKVVEDSGISASSVASIVANAVTGPGSATDDNVVTFNGTSGKTVQDSGVSIAEVQQAIDGQWGTATDYSEFESNGVLHMAGQACVWDDYAHEGVSLKSGSSAPDLILYNGGPLQVYGFDGGNSPEQLFGTLEVKHAYLQGSNLVPHIHWEPTTANAGNVKWFLDYRWTNDGEIAGVITTISIIQAAGGTAWKANRADWAAITGTGKKIGSTIVFRLHRSPTDVQDTYPDDAAFISFGFHYQKDTVGSRGIVTK